MQRTYIAEIPGVSYDTQNVNVIKEDTRMDKEKFKMKKQLWLMFALGGMVGIFLFLVTFGYRVLDVTYDGWLRDVRQFDRTLAYKGWLFFRDSEWSWPLGLIDDLTYPSKVSIVYTDSLPLVAIILKLFNGILPDTFQYMGIYILLIYVLQGGLSSLIMYKLTNNKFVSVVASILMTCSSIMLIKCIVQVGIASNYMILGAFLLYLFKEEISYRKKAIWSVVLTFLAVGINVYYVPWVLGILCFMQIEVIIKKKNWRALLKEGGIIFLDVIVGVLTLYVLGGFEGEVSASSNGLGLVSANINTLFNSFGKTGWFFSPVLPCNPGQYAGFAYLGYSGMLLLLASLFLVLKNRRRVWDGIKRDKVSVITVSVFFLIFYVYALSNKVYLGSKLLIEWPLPDFVIKLFSIFRTTGRFVYPVFYGILIITMAVVFKLGRKKGVYVFLSVCAVLHLIEFSNMMSSINNDLFKTVYDDVSIYMNSHKFWEDIAVGKDELIFMTAHNRNNQVPVVLAGKEASEEIAFWAYDHNLRINDTYLARRSGEQVKKYREEQWERLYNGEISDDVIYVFFETIPTKCVQDKLLNIYYVDDFYVGIKEEIAADRYEGVIKIEDIKEVNVLPSQWQYVQNASYLNEGLRIYPEGYFDGMKLPLRAGAYQVEIHGDGLKEEEISCRDRGAFSIDIDITEASSQRIVYTFELDVDGNIVEFVYNNDHDEDVVIKEILLTEN